MGKVKKGKWLRGPVLLVSPIVHAELVDLLRTYPLPPEDQEELWRMAGSTLDEAGDEAMIVILTELRKVFMEIAMEEAAENPI